MRKQDQQRGGKGSGPVAPAPEVVEPIWLIKAFLTMVLIALACGYLTLCGMFYRGQWQLVLHPARTSAAPETAGGVPIEVVHFGAEVTGLPQLTGWWIAAGRGSAYPELTILFLPGGEGSLADDQGTLAQLHDAGLAIFAIDYRGYGQSAAMRPSEASMTADAERAWEYVTGSRGIAADRVIPYGRGLGASLALGLAAGKGVAPAVILDAPDFDVRRRVMEDSRSRLVPVGLLLRERFELDPLLGETKIPKLILSRGERENAAVLRAADPKMTVLLRTLDTNAFEPTLRRFLDQYVRAVGSLRSVPSGAPPAQMTR